MIKIRIKNMGHETDIQFPLREEALQAKLSEIHVNDGIAAAQSIFVTEVYWPEELSMLKDGFANLDELNYLAKRMESFNDLEYDQFIIGIRKLDNPSVKDLINLTFNLDRFTLCRDVSSYGKIGRAYVLNVMGAVPAHDEDDPNYTVIGRDLIRRGLAEITEKGVLIYDPSDELAGVYDGHTFPQYYYDNTLVSVVASYNGRSELLQLPGEELPIEKALARLGAPSDQACDITLEFHSVNNVAWAQRILDIMNEEGLYAGNRMLHSLDHGDMNWDKLSAITELANAHTAANIAYLADHRDNFEFIPGVACVEDKELIRCSIR